MRVPRVRFRLLTLMIVVTAIVAGLGYTAYLSYLRRRAAEFRALAAYHSQEEVRARAALEPRYHHRYGIDEPSQLRDRAEDCRYWAAAYRRRESYARAALARAESRGLPTTQAERREPWHWEMRVAELEHEARWAEAR